MVSAFQKYLPHDVIHCVTSTVSYNVLLPIKYERRSFEGRQNKILNLLSKKTIVNYRILHISQVAEKSPLALLEEACNSIGALPDSETRIRPIRKRKIDDAKCNASNSKKAVPKRLHEPVASPPLVDSTTGLGNAFSSTSNDVNSASCLPSADNSPASSKFRKVLPDQEVNLISVFYTRHCCWSQSSHFTGWFNTNSEFILDCYSSRTH